MTTQVRYAHTDIEVPDFTPYRKSSTKDPASRNADTAESRKAFTYLIIGGKSLLSLKQWSVSYITVLQF